MKFPFVARSTHEIAVRLLEERIVELKARLAKAEEDHEKFVDILGGRAIGQSVYGRIVPPQDVTVEEDEAEPKKPELPYSPSALEQDIENHGTKARGLARRAQQRNEAEIREAERVYEMARQAGIEAAEAKSNGNGNHSK